MPKRVRILSDTSGSTRGMHTQEYEEGEVLECGTRRMSEQLAEILVDAGDAEWISKDEPDEEKPEGPSEAKPEGPSETKPEVSQDLSNVSFEGGSYEVNGAWKTFFDEDGWELGKAQCTKDEAEAWVDGDVSLTDLKD